MAAMTLLAAVALGLVAAVAFGGIAGGLGLIGMRARARSAGGDMEVRSRPGEGVCIEVRAPIRAEALGREEA